MNPLVTMVWMFGGAAAFVVGVWYWQDSGWAALAAGGLAAMILAATELLWEK
jgi:hypothetical protein